MISRRARAGFSLVEAVVAIVILGVAITSISALMVQVSRSSLRVSGDSYKNSVLTQEINRIESMPFDSVAVGTQTTTVTSLPYPHTRVISVTSGDRVKRIQIVITPTGYYFRRDSVVVYRRNPVPTKSFNTAL